MSGDGVVVHVHVPAGQTPLQRACTLFGSLLVAARQSLGAREWAVFVEILIIAIARESAAMLELEERAA